MVTKVEVGAVPVTYRVEDLMDEEISGRFYAEDLQLIKYDATFKIDKVQEGQGDVEVNQRYLFNGCITLKTFTAG